MMRSGTKLALALASAIALTGAARGGASSWSGGSEAGYRVTANALFGVEEGCLSCRGTLVDHWFTGWYCNEFEPCVSCFWFDGCHVWQAEGSCMYPADAHVLCGGGPAFAVGVEVVADRLSRDLAVDDYESVRQVVEEAGGVLTLNQSRRALQALDCKGMAFLHIPLSQEDAAGLASALADLGAPNQ